MDIRHQLAVTSLFMHGQFASKHTRRVRRVPPWASDRKALGPKVPTLGRLPLRFPTQTPVHNRNRDSFSTTYANSKNSNFTRNLNNAYRKYSKFAVAFFSMRTKRNAASIPNLKKRRNTARR